MATILDLKKAFIRIINLRIDILKHSKHLSDMLKSSKDCFNKHSRWHHAKFHQEHYNL